MSVQSRACQRHQKPKMTGTFTSNRFPLENAAIPAGEEKRAGDSTWTSQRHVRGCQSVSGQRQIMPEWYATFCSVLSQDGKSPNRLVVSHRLPVCVHRVSALPAQLCPYGRYSSSVVVDSLDSIALSVTSICLLIIIIIIMYIYHALINALSAQMIHINLNMIFYTHVEHSPTKTVYIKYYYYIKIKKIF